MDIEFVVGSNGRFSVSLNCLSVRLQVISDFLVHGFMGSWVHGSFVLVFVSLLWAKSQVQNTRSKQKGVWFSAIRWAALTSRSS